MTTPANRATAHLVRPADNPTPVVLAQCIETLRALRIAGVRTEVDWNDTDLVSFFGKIGFSPVARLVLKCEVDSA